MAHGIVMRLIAMRLLAAVILIAAEMAAVTALLVSLLYYRGFPLSQTLWVIADAIRSAGTIMLIVASALAGWPGRLAGPG